MKSKKIIGIVPLVDYGRDSLWLVPGYMEGIAHAGGLPIMLPLTSNTDIIEQLVQMCDGFLMTGGQDVSPSIYNAPKTALCGECSAERDHMETVLLEKALAADKPVLGICRGIQLLNAFLGGTLYQDIPTEYPSELKHHQAPPYDVPSHEINILSETPLYQIFGKDRIAVNSYHHQAIKDLSPQLKVMALATDGLAEAVYMPNKLFVWALQWHPEFSYRTDENSRRIFEAFVQSCGKI